MTEKPEPLEEEKTIFGLPIYEDSYEAEYRNSGHDYFGEDVTDEERDAMKSWEEQHPLDRSKMTRKKWQQNWYAALDELRVQRAREQVEKAAEPPTEAPEN